MRYYYLTGGLLLLSNRGVCGVRGVCVFIVYVTFLELENKVTICLDHNVVHSVAVAASVLNGNLSRILMGLINDVFRDIFYRVKN